MLRTQRRREPLLRREREEREREREREREKEREQRKTTRTKTRENQKNEQATNTRPTREKTSNTAQPITDTSMKGMLCWMATQTNSKTTSIINLGMQYHLSRSKQVTSSSLIPKTGKRSTRTQAKNKQQTPNKANGAKNKEQNQRAETWTTTSEHKACTKQKARA